MGVMGMNENPLPHVPSLVVGRPPGVGVGVGVGVGRVEVVDVEVVVTIGGIEELEVVDVVDVVDLVDVVEVVGGTTTVDEMVGGITIVDDDDDITSPHEPYRGLHPTPQYSAELPQYQYGEQHWPKLEPAQTVLLPHIPFVETRVPVGKGGRTEVLDVVGTTIGVVVRVDEVVGGNWIVVLVVEEVVGVSGIEVLLVVLVVGVGVGVGGKEVVDGVGNGSPSQYPYAA
ncbi:hypothetical protein IFR05_012353 [Cadophora sp. M221]|nr:hypothetical protein IFR05_012353 [Cadophora sp. M221]